VESEAALMLGLLAALSAVAVGEVCATLLAVGGAVKIVLDSIEVAQRIRKAAREEKP
jgi:hypothetical protein